MDKFARIKFREWKSLTYFAGINFRESFFDLTFVFYRHFPVLCFVSYASSILPHVLFVIKRYNAYQCIRKKKHCLYTVYTLNDTPSSFLKNLLFFILFSREKTFVEIAFANLPKIRENRESFFPRKFLPLK